MALLATSGALFAQDSASPFVFRDVGKEAGVLPDASGIRGHAAGWGDVNGDGDPDLYVATFHNEGSKANQLFLNRGGRFELSDDPVPQISSRASAAIFVDLDNDGDLDLYVSSMPAKKDGRELRGCVLLRNDDGKFKDVSADNGACPAAFGGRSAAALDFNGDGRLDLLVGEDPLTGYNGSTTKSSRLFRNDGDLKFSDVTREAGIPADIPGYGVAAADVNNDSWPDIFIASHRGGNVLLLNDGRGRFRVAERSKDIFAWPEAKGDDMVCGICFGDVNRDGLLDAVIGQHFDSPWRKPVANRLYLNRGIHDGEPKFEDVTKLVGLVPLPLKGPHVELQDFDNDGWPDLYVSIVKFQESQPHPLIFRNLGVKNGLPQFREEVLGLNDFPNADDLATKGSKGLFDKIIRDKTILYTAPGPTADFNNDGRLDMFLASWWLEAPSMLLQNETRGGHWLQIQVAGTNRVNRQGLGSRVKLYPAGKLGDPASLIGCSEIAVGYGYTSGQTAMAHFGLGKLERVDIEVTLPHGQDTWTRKSIAADQRITIGEEK